MSTEEHLTRIDGSAGTIEILVNLRGTPKGIALICHPHPLFGGTNTNKVVHTLARTLTKLGYVALRPNFRGVGQSTGTHDEGIGETDDMLAVLADAQQRYGDLPVVLAGYSFGAYVQTRVAQSLVDSGRTAERMVLVGTAAGHIEGLRHFATRAVGRNTLIIHGSADTTVPLANVLAWAEPLETPVVVIPGADHFFHRRLHLIREIVERAWAC